LSHFFIVGTALQEVLFSQWRVQLWHDSVWNLVSRWKAFTWYSSPKREWSSVVFKPSAKNSSTKSTFKLIETIQTHCKTTFI